jgi:hypothetical protein
LWNKLKSLTGSDKETSNEAEGLTSAQMGDGLREALAQGVEKAIRQVGKPDGFLADELVRIAVPDQLSSLAKTARKLGQDKYVDSFETAMNRAAEQAAPAAADIFGAAVREMTVEDAAAIVRGPDDAATQYFRSTSGVALHDRLLPLVTEATESAGVTRSYKKLQSKAGGMLGSFMNTDDVDLDEYVTNKTLDGLFTYIAIEEEKIRTDPLARGTDLLKAVFGSK